MLAVVVILWFWSLVVWTVTVAPPSAALAYTFLTCSSCTDPVGNSIPRMMSLISSWVKLATFTLFFLE